MTQEAIYLIMEIDPVSEMWFVNPTIMNDVQNKLSWLYRYYLQISLIIKFKFQY